VRYDRDQNGVLDRKEFRNVLSSSRLALTNKYALMLAQWIMLTLNATFTSSFPFSMHNFVSTSGRCSGGIDSPFARISFCSYRQIMKIMSELDEDNDGKLSYTEFLPFTVELLQTMHAKQEMEMAREQEEEAARCASHPSLLLIFRCGLHKLRPVTEKRVCVCSLAKGGGGGLFAARHASRRAGEHDARNLPAIGCGSEWFSQPEGVPGVLEVRA
jgi:hypothetical protein